MQSRGSKLSGLREAAECALGALTASLRSGLSYNKSCCEPREHQIGNLWPYAYNAFIDGIKGLVVAEMPSVIFP